MKTTADIPRKTALITGCSQGGLGHALAESFARRGFQVLATVRNPAAAAAAASSAASNGQIEFLSLDVTSPESVGQCVTEVRDKIGDRGLDVLVNNAGVGFVMPLLDTSIEESKRLYEVNVWGVLAVTQAFAPLLLEAKGTILNISSLAGAVRMAWQGSYNSSKAALTCISETLRIELEPLGVRVVTAMVGEVETSFYRHSLVSFALPTGSHYKQIEDTIGRQARGELQSSNERADVTADNIVNDVIGGRSGQIWRGGVAGTAKYASWLLPSKLFEWALHRPRGVYDLRYPA